MKRWCGCGPGDDLSVGAELPLSGVAAVALALTGAPVEACSWGLGGDGATGLCLAWLAVLSRSPRFPMVAVHLFSPLGSRTGRAIVEGLRLEEVATGWVLHAGWERAL